MTPRVSFASGGHRVKAHLIDRIIDSTGENVFETDAPYVCDDCPPVWFDDRQIEAEAQLPKFFETVAAVPETAEDAEPAEVDAAGEPVEPLELGPDPDAGIPKYVDANAMMDHASDWRPKADEAPEFFADRNQALRVISPQNAYIVYDMMRDVIRRGTGRRARELGRRDLAGKTGTSNDRRDAWFSGFNKELVTIAWVGFDDDRSLGAGEEGSRTALPVWKYFMADALDGMPEAPLSQPPGIVTVRISPESGLVAPSSDSDAIFEIFRDGHVPALRAEKLGEPDYSGTIYDDEDESIF